VEEEFGEALGGVRRDCGKCGGQGGLNCLEEGEKGWGEGFGGCGDGI